MSARHDDADRTAGWTEVVLRSDTLEVSLLPSVGARIHRIRAFGRDLLRTPDDPAAHREEPFSWGAYPMAPWCNRAPAAPMAVAGRTVKLTPNFPDGTAIHGLVATEPWTSHGDGSFEVVRRAGEAWPWAFATRLTAHLNGDEVTLALTLANLDDAPMPAGLGLHPWFARPLELRVPGAAVYASNVASCAEPEPVAGSTNLRSLATPALGLDGTWTALEEPAIELAWPALGVLARLEIRSSASGPLVAVATPEAIEAAAVEPQTHGPDPLRRLANGEPDAPVLLQPGSELSLTLHLRFSYAPGLRSGRPTLRHIQRAAPDDRSTPGSFDESDADERDGRRAAAFMLPGVRGVERTARTARLMRDPADGWDDGGWLCTGPADIRPVWLAR